MRALRPAVAVSRSAAPWLLLLVVACGAPSNPPTGGTSSGVSLSYPSPDQTLSGTVALAAATYGGAGSDLRFDLGGLVVDARADGTAYVDTRSLTDGDHTLRTSAVVGGAAVEAQIAVRVDNDLSASASVGVSGGSVQSSAGSLATIPPGALAASTIVSTEDASQAGILADFGVDYPALGVTFLGALEVDTSGVDVDLPFAVDLAGWAPAVQPGQAVVMFALAPDADGDGQGELMFAASAEATDGGSVITRPVPKSETYGFGSPGTLARQQIGTVRPGEVITLSGRGFNASAPLSNAARYGSPTSPTAATLVHVTVAESAAFNPLLQVQLAVPALPAGSHTLRLHNLNTGYRAEPLTLTIGTAGTGSASTWTAFVDQVAVAVERLTAQRADLATLARGWRDTLGAHSGSVAAAMASHSGLVSASHRTALDSMTAGALTAAQRDLVARHALVLDAISASEAALRTPAADLATLLMVTSQGSSAASAGVGPQQGGGASCSGGGSTPATGINLGNPVTTGMGSAPPGSCTTGNNNGPNGPAAGALSTLSTSELASSSLRPGTFRPVPGAVVVVYRQGTDQRLAPFTAIADATGFFHIPFVAPGEPFTVRAIDPATGNTASSDGVSAGVNVVTPVQLIYGPGEAAPGSPTASFTVTAIADPDFEGSVYYDFDASGSSDADGEIVEYVWDFDGFAKSLGDTPTVRRGFGREGSYTIRLTVIDDEGKFGVSQQVLTIDDLPYDYWGTPPIHVDRLPDGTTHGSEAEDHGFALSADERFAVFSIGQYSGGDLLPADTNGLRDVYRKNLSTGALELVSEGTAGVETGHEGVSISADGRYVAYSSRLDRAPARIHVRDMVTDTLVTIEFTDTFLALPRASLSGDGRKVLYERPNSLANPGATGTYVHDLVEDVTDRLDGGLGRSAVPVAMAMDGAYALVQDGFGALYRFDLDSLTAVRVDTDADGAPADALVSTGGAALSADGRLVVFSTRATNLVPEVPEPFTDHVYLKDMETGAIERVTRNPRTGADANMSSGKPVISPDGRVVLFSSWADNLTPLVEKYGAEFGFCALGQCPTGMIYAFDVTTGRLALAEVGFDHTTPCCSSNSNRLIAPTERFIAFSSYNRQLAQVGDGDTMRVLRSANPWGLP